MDAKKVFCSVIAFAAANVLCAQSNYATPYTFSTLAGLTKPQGSGDGTYTSARFNAPAAVATDGAGNFYVADTGNYTIRKLASDGTVTTLAGFAGVMGSADGVGIAARFNFPNGVAVDSAGNVYVADTGNQTIRKITSSGLVTTFAGLAGVNGSADGIGSAARFAEPHSLAVDTSGNVYVADTGNQTIREITSGGVVTTLAGIAGSHGAEDGTGSIARFLNPAGVAVDTAGSVYVADTGNGTIRKIAPAGAVTTLAGAAGVEGSADGIGSAARFNNPYGVAVDTEGNIFVADTINSTIRQITSDGVVSTLAGLAGRSGDANGTGSAAQFALPFGIAVDNAGNVYTADSANEVIRKITFTGMVSTFAGSDALGGLANGTGTLARFADPQGVAVDAAGNLYVADSGNDAVRKITSGGVVTTLAGGAGLGDPFETNGQGSEAVFGNPFGIAADTAGNIYVADKYSCTIRKITSGGLVTTLAGSAGASGSADGIGSGARFNSPTGIAVDAAGNVYVADTGNDTIREITSGGTVTTLAGATGFGSEDGPLSVAKFYDPQGIAVDPTGNIYVADTGNGTIRKIASTGEVTTLAGTAGVFGTADGTGNAAQFGSLQGIAVDTAGNVFVTDGLNYTVRRITPGGVVTTLAGLTGISDWADGVGSGARFMNPVGIAVDPEGNLYVADAGNDIIRWGSEVTPSFNSASTTAGTDGQNFDYTTTFNGALTEFTASGLPYGLSINPATGVISGIPDAAPGTYTVTLGATNGAGTGTGALDLTVNVGPATVPARLVNLSARAFVNTGSNILIAGFGISGSGTKQLLLRAVGPRLTLDPFDITDALANAQLGLYDGGAPPETGPELIASDNGWANNTVPGNSPVPAVITDTTAAIMSTLGAFPYATGSLDSAVDATLPVGDYSSEISGLGANPTGVALAEIYDADTGVPAARLVNISARASIGTGFNILIAGFAIAGNTSETVLIRGIGPRLGQSPFDLTGFLAAPQLTLYDGNVPSQIIAANSGWSTAPTTGPSTVVALVQPATASVMLTVGAFALTAGSNDSAMLVSLPPGNYTAQLSGVNSTTGIGLIEVYEAP